MSTIAVTLPVAGPTSLWPLAPSRPGGSPLDAAQSSSSTTTARLHLPGVKMLAGSTLASLLSQQVVGPAIGASDDASAPDDADQDNADDMDIAAPPDQDDAEVGRDTDDVDSTPDAQATVIPQALQEDAFIGQPGPENGLPDRSD